MSEMTQNDDLKAITRDREDATGNVRQFVPRSQPGGRKADEAVKNTSGAPKTHPPAGDSYDPGPTAA
jgi:hypothetical protein